MKYHMVNTRKGHSNTAHKRMLKDKVVMACHSTRDEIEEISKGDFVFLFQNKVGIIAMGRASGVRKIVNFEQIEDAGMIQKLSGFTRLKTPIQAATVTAMLRNFAGYKKGVYAKTRVEIPTNCGIVLRAVGEAVS